MKLDSINRWLTLIANLGVLAGVIFLVIELRQNNVIAKAETRSEMSRISVENTRMYQDPFAIALFSKVNRGEELTLEERGWLLLAYESEFKAWQNIYYQYRVGLFDEPELEAYRGTWRNRFRGCRPLVLRSYSSTRSQLEPKYREEMDSILEQSNCD
ncbi:MAG: hypothetical protein R3F50_04790 [Gammaproteobacteria bacterium]